MGELSEKAAGWLRLAGGPGSAMYPGVPWECAPKTFAALRRRGLVDEYAPHNPAHKTRAVATAAGHRALRASPEPTKTGE